MSPPEEAEVTLQEDVVGMDGHDEDVFGGSRGGNHDEDVLKEQDRVLPIANVARIMKQAVPSSAKVAKDAKETVQECVSEFIAFVTSE
jgi:histone H3/H4